MGRLIRANGKEEEKHPFNRKYYNLSELQDFVGGYIELVHLNKDRVLVVNEEGWQLGLPYNRKASALATRSLRRNIFIMGAALLCNSNEIK